MRRRYLHEGVIEEHAIGGVVGAVSRVDGVRGVGIDETVNDRVRCEELSTADRIVDFIVDEIETRRR